MRTFKTKAFNRFAEKAGITDGVLCGAVAAAERGSIAADLGGGVIKQRIARPGQGKSGGFRTLIVFRVATRAIFIHGFAKNEKGNVEPGELVALKKLAADLLAYDDRALAKTMRAGALLEVICDEEAIS